MTTTFFLVRHGSHDRLDRVLCGRMPGVSLSEGGRAEARRVADRLAREPIAAVYASPLERARETATPLAERLGLPVEIDSGLDEIDLGAWAGKGFDALHGEPAWAAWNTVRSVTRPPGGETFLEAQARVVGLIERLRASHRDAGVAMVSHGDIIKAALCFHLGLPLDLAHRFAIGPASVSTLVVGDWGARVERLNEAPPP